MKISKKQLKQIILEELTMLQTEADELSAGKHPEANIGDWLFTPRCAKDLDDCRDKLKASWKKREMCQDHMSRAIGIIDKQRKKIKELERKCKEINKPNKPWPFED